MTNKEIYLRFCRDALRIPTNYWEEDRPRKFIKALRELVEKCPELEREELVELLLEAERDLL